MNPSLRVKLNLKSYGNVKINILRYHRFRDKPDNFINY